VFISSIVPLALSYFLHLTTDYPVNITFLCLYSRGQRLHKDSAASEATVCTSKRTLPLIPLSIANKMQRYKIFFITVNALYVSDGFFAHHRELNTVHSIWYMSSLLAATASSSSKQA
jgi:hypothetical protein